MKENSCFDGLNRLTSALITSTSACTGTGAVTMTYDTLGNITSKSDICATAGCFAYGGSGAGPHALTSVTGVVNGVTNPTFAYDANGMMTSGAGRTIAPTTFDMAGSLTSVGAAACVTRSTSRATARRSKSASMPRPANCSRTAPRAPTPTDAGGPAWTLANVGDRAGRHSMTSAGA